VTFENCLGSCSAFYEWCFVQWQAAVVFYSATEVYINGGHNGGLGKKYLHSVDAGATFTMQVAQSAAGTLNLVAVRATGFGSAQVRHPPASELFVGGYSQTRPFGRGVETRGP
jgi:hypothetical protein